MKKLNPFILTLLLVVLLTNSCSKDDTDSSTGENLDENNILKLEAFDLYSTDYLTSELNANDNIWINGNLDSCEAGSISETAKNKMLRRLLYFRKAVGLTNTITINPDKSEKAQEAALMCRVNNDLNHNPPASWDCYTEDGRTAASKSNLAFFSNTTTSAVDLYIGDDGNSNFAAGHRRWLLWPRLQDIGLGNTDRTNAIWVIGDAGPVPDDNPEFISWPPKGYVPSNLVYNRWSFSLANADFSNATVSIKNSQGNALAVTIENIVSGFGDNTIVWRPSNVNTNSTADVSYTVNINNVLVSGESTNFEYDVILFDVDEI